MPLQTWEAIANFTNQDTVGSAYNTSTSATDVSPPGNSGQFTLGANTLIIGQTYRLTAWGYYSTTSAPTLTIGFYYGGAGGTALCATAATTTGSSVSNLMWRAQAEVSVQSLGSSGSVYAFGTVIGIAATASTPVLMPASSSTGNLVTINTTTSNTLTCGATWGTNSASNTLICVRYLIEQLI